MRALDHAAQVPARRPEAAQGLPQHGAVRLAALQVPPRDHGDQHRVHVLAGEQRVSIAAARADYDRALAAATQAAVPMRPAASGAATAPYAIKPATSRTPQASRAK